MKDLFIFSDASKNNKPTIKQKVMVFVLFYVFFIIPFCLVVNEMLARALSGKLTMMTTVPLGILAAFCFLGLMLLIRRTIGVVYNPNGMKMPIFLMAQLIATNSLIEMTRAEFGIYPF